MYQKNYAGCLLDIYYYILFFVPCGVNVPRDEERAARRKSEGKPPQRGRPRGRARTPRPPPQSEQRQPKPAEETANTLRRHIETAPPAHIIADALPTPPQCRPCAQRAGGAARCGVYKRAGEARRRRRGGRSARAQSESVDNPRISAYLSRHLRNIRLTVAVDT